MELCTFRVCFHNSVHGGPIAGVNSSYKNATDQIKFATGKGLLALSGYCLTVSGNRIGHISNGGMFTMTQLKILQEGIALSVFLAISIF